MKDNGTNEMPWYMNIFNKDAIENFAKEHKKRNYKSIEHIIDNARFFMESTHELAYDHGYSDGQIEASEKIRAEIEDFCKKSNITCDSSISACLDIIDKYREEQK